MAGDPRQINQLVCSFRAGNLTRRQFVEKLFQLGLSLGAVSSIVSACGEEAAPASPTPGSKVTPTGATTTPVSQVGDASDRALRAAADLAKEAAPGSKITILHPAGSLGNLKPFVPEWQEATGIPIEFIEVPLTEVHTKGMEEAVAKTGRYDLMLPSPISLPDWAEAGLIYDLTDWVRMYDPQIDTGDCPVVSPLNLHGNLYKGRVYGLCTDGDIWSLYLRRDKLEDATEQRKFREQFGYDLKIPDTWNEYYDLIKFFNRPEENFYGGLEYRARYYVKWEWMQKFVSKGRLYFDDEMNALVNTPEGIEALQEMIAITPYLDPGVTTYGWAENYAAFGQGRAFCTFSWPSFDRYNRNPQVSVVYDKMAYGVVPGTEINGKLVRAAMFSFSWAWTVSKYSKNPELAYLCAQFYYGPRVSTRAIPNEGGYFDPFRTCHFDDPTIEKAYGKEALEVQLENLKIAIPDFVLPGGFEYQEALDKNLHEALAGAKDPKQALDDAAEEMNAITERIGRERQIEAWRALRDTFPQSILAAIKA